MNDTRTLRRCLGRSVSGRDAGIAMVVAVAVIMLVSIVVVTIVTVALRETGMSGRERQRAVAIASAEGQVDSLVSQVDQAVIKTIPCGEIKPDVVSVIGRDEMTITSIVEYFTASKTLMSCVDVHAGQAAATASVRATSTSTALNNKSSAIRKFETIVNLVPDASLKQAIFGDTTGVIIGSPNSEIKGSPLGGDNGNIYSTGVVNCGGDIAGSVYGGSKVTFTKDCSGISGDVKSLGDVKNEDAKMTVGGDISSLGNIDLGSKSGFVLNGTAQAKVSFSGTNCSKCVKNPLLEVSQPNIFPIITQSSEWTNAAPDGAGFELVTITKCLVEKNDKDPNSLGYWLTNLAKNINKPTLIRMPDNCIVKLDKISGAPIGISDNVAIFARGSNSTKEAFDFSGSPSFVGLGGDARNLYFIQDLGPSTCTATVPTGINVGNSFNSNVPSIRIFFYTPYNLLLESGNEIFSGQIYAGCKVSSTHKLILTYDPLPLYGVSNKLEMSIRTEVVAKREIS